MLVALILLFMAGIKNAQGKEGRGYFLFIMGMLLFFHIGSELITSSTELVDSIYLLNGFVICTCVSGIAYYIYKDNQNNKSRNEY